MNGASRRPSVPNAFSSYQEDRVGHSSKTSLESLSNLSIQTSILGSPIGSPLNQSVISTPSSVNNPGYASASLYQICVTVKERLKEVPDFPPYLEYARQLAEENPSANIVPGVLEDPVNILWTCFRLGSSLCVLFNALRPVEVLPLLEDVENATFSERKKAVFHFLMACQKELGWANPELFLITQLYSHDTSGFIKVIKTVTMILEILEYRKLLSPRNGDGDKENMVIAVPKPTNNQSKVMDELLETERKYVHDLETLQNYKRVLREDEVISADHIHLIFPNLDLLVDFQRKFLIGVEANAALNSEQQRLGALFLSLEDQFGIYEAYCSNYREASDLAQKEIPKLAKKAHILEPTYVLPSLLIKPIQRICKYPLLLRELEKYSDPNSEYFDEIVRGREAIKRVADRVNERSRKLENAKVAKDLQSRIDDWKGYRLDALGELLLSATFLVMKADEEREYQVFLFERILLCCKEIAAVKKQNKSLSKKSKTRASLLLKGRIYVHTMTDISATSDNGVYKIQICWRGDDALEHFTLRCRNEEALRQWQSALDRLVEENRREQDLRRKQVDEIPNTELVSMTQGSISHLKQQTLMDGESDDSEAFTNDIQSDNSYQNISASPISKTASNQTFPRSRSATGDSVNSMYTRVPSASRYHHAHQLLSNGGVSPSVASPDKYGASYFSPAAESHASSRTSSASGAYPFPRQGTPVSINPGYNASDIDLSQSIVSPMHSSSREKVNRFPPRPNGSVLQNRMRSASSPSIHHVESNTSSLIPIPRIPDTYLANVVSVGNVGASDVHDSTRSPALNADYSSPSGGTVADGFSGGMVKVKLSFQNDLYIVKVPVDVSYSALLERTERKIRNCGHQIDGKDGRRLKIKYQDEDGDFITVNSDEDVQMAMESRLLHTDESPQSSGSILNLRVVL